MKKISFPKQTNSSNQSIGMGIIQPIEFNFAQIKGIAILIMILSFTQATLAQLPETFDLRNVDGVNYVTSVKSQNGGTCWPQGSLASMEGNLLMNGNWEAQGESGEPNLAEYHLDWWNGYNQYFNQDLEEPYNNGQGLEVHMGGDYRVTTAYMSRLEGAVRDMDGQSYNSPPIHFSPDFHIYYPKRVEWYNAGQDLSNIDLIKEKVMEQGVMATCMCYSNSFISGTNHYQPPSDNQEPNHSVSIIGWDDNHVTQAPEPGAWLVKNSWGTGWGNAGYFWISYFDKHACKNPEMGAISFIDVDLLDFDTAYYHDYHGWRDTLTTASEAFNAFTAHVDEDIVAVSFFTAENNVDFVVKIFGEFTDDQLNNELLSDTGFIEFSGLHTINLSETVSFFEGQQFYVYLHLSAGGHPYDRTSDVPVLLGASSRAIVPSTASEQQSYYKENDQWLDFYNFNDPSGFQNTGNFCIKALANHNPTLGFESPTLKAGGFNKVMPCPVIDFGQIDYQISEAGQVTIAVYSAQGQLIQTINEGNQSQGSHQIQWNSQHLPAGVYMLILSVNGQPVDQIKVVKM